MAFKDVTPEMMTRLDNDFTYHAPFGDQTQRYEALRAVGKAAAASVVALTPGSREQSTALTKIDEFVFWANAAIARNEKPEEEAAATEPPIALAH